MRKQKVALAAALCVSLALGAAGCGGKTENVASGTETGKTVDQRVKEVQDNPHIPQQSKAGIIQRIQQSQPTGKPTTGTNK